MRKWLLKRWSWTEKQRLEIQEILHESVINEYSEQTPYGNVYNSYIEFILSNNFIRRNVEEQDKSSLKTLKSGLNKAFDESIRYIKKEQDLIKIRFKDTIQ